MNKPTKPSVTLPSSFGGDKSNFSADKIANGYEPDVPDILGGANLNYLLDTLGRKETYYDTIVDFIKDIPINKTIGVNANNQLVYINSNIDDKVNKSGDTMSGQLKIKKSGLAINYCGTDLDFTTFPSSNTTAPAFRISDKNENRMGNIDYVYRSNGSHSVIISDKKDNNTATYANLSVGWDTSGRAIADAPTPPDTSNNTNIATTAWVRTRIANSVSYNSSTRTLTIG